MTNREWLATLSDEEFAKWRVLVECRSCAHKPEKGLCNNLNGIVSYNPNCCIDGTAEWLQMEHKEGKL